MLKPIKRVLKCSISTRYQLRRNLSALKVLPVGSTRPNVHKTDVKATCKEDFDYDIARQRYVKRNELGVQMLSRGLHRQIFKSVKYPNPPQSFVQISKEHLRLHGLDPSQGSVLPDTTFQLPPLQGANISEHFHRIGTHASEPWLSFAKTFATTQIAPKPDCWHIQSGWTKYYYSPDGASYGEHVEFPFHDGKPEEMLTFDVETLPKLHPYPIMACAATPNAWYAWISPWLLGESADPQHLIPFGNAATPKLIVGHNVAYDRIRMADEYDVVGSANRFIDTMSLHIAVTGISSHQRPAWRKYRKAKVKEEEQQDEAVAALVGLLQTVRQREMEETDPSKRKELHAACKGMEDSLLQIQTQNASSVLEPVPDDDGASADPSKRWEDITAANSLADVARLHCGITLDKEIRSDLMTEDVDHVRDNLSDFLDYCATDVSTTHQVYSVTLPAFLTACPHPASFAGMLTMGSSFLTVDDSWERYLENADSVYRKMEENVQTKLKELAEEAKRLMDTGEEKWRDDPWLSQLDWTPKVASKSRGIVQELFEPVPTTVPSLRPKALTDLRPAWYLQLIADPFSGPCLERILPLVLKISSEGQPMILDKKEGWYTLVDGNHVPVEIMKGKKTRKIIAKASIKFFERGQFASEHLDTALALCRGEKSEEVLQQVVSIADQVLDRGIEKRENDPWLSQLDWTLHSLQLLPSTKVKKVKKPKPVKPPPVLWPKWYWDATAPKKGMPPGSLDVTVRTRVAPILLRLSWSGYPLFHSREHGWTFRVPTTDNFKTRAKAVSFYDPNDEALSQALLSGGYTFYKLPHKDGEEANVANPLGKTFIKYVQDGVLKSPGSEAKEALDLNSLCSYWMSARDRILNQLVVWQNSNRSLSLPSPPKDRKKYGIILPQVIQMGTVTRRAIEKTWLTASNAKKNRVGSELKAMVRAPEGYAIVGADVDSEELWISSCMGDAQFGLHGASAIGWMTLEGTKAAGTDLHSKTASILGISRDQAKVFNYSRIYGAGMRHAVLLLLQSNPSMRSEEAQKLAENLYASTKGKNTHRSDLFDRKFWFGGTETYLFNKLEEIAQSDKPQTPALGCGVTYALSKDYLPEGFGTDYMPSRINWVVQSSGVDYLHMLIVAMTHLINKYKIDARYLISVHDELRYLVVEKDKYRAALALQIANLWTRSMFAYKLGMDDLPQGVAFFSAVDVDHVLRKEVDMPCVTPSQPNSIAPGESLDIIKVLEQTNGGSLQQNGAPMPEAREATLEGTLNSYVENDCLVHRAKNAAWLKAQASTDFGEVKGLAEMASGKKYADTIAKKRKSKPRQKRAPLGSGEGVDWSETVERLLTS
ncbi:gamma DNA-directed DNA polymerase [Crepidotus variabilis]|uniref:Mitochondrial DNA polymerase catalytic subunit n=1 Tax=Crepidotus variabilis TaxID=179855 RepID=A0A9P6JKY8_9AGAR|nr:gamma DNA-directed DNA polymerase [Crepidotus variabilis]